MTLQTYLAGTPANSSSLPSLLVVSDNFAGVSIADSLVVLNDPERYEAFDDVATTVVCDSARLSTALGDSIKQTLRESPPIL